MASMSSPDAPLPALDETALERQHGITAESVSIVRALADVIAPALDDCPAASEVGAHLRAAHSLEMLQRGSTTLLTRMLNMYSRAERRGARFLELDQAARGRVLRALAEEDLDEMRDLVESVHAFILEGYLAGWSATASTQRPRVWDTMGFHGPARGHLDMVAQPRPRVNKRYADA
jgi:hypothetical protein